MSLRLNMSPLLQVQTPQRAALAACGLPLPAACRALPSLNPGQTSNTTMMNPCHLSSSSYLPGTSFTPRSLAVKVNPLQTRASGSRPGSSPRKGSGLVTCGLGDFWGAVPPGVAPGPGQLSQGRAWEWFGEFVQDAVRVQQGFAELEEAWPKVVEQCIKEGCEGQYVMPSTAAAAGGQNGGTKGRGCKE